jgi:dihydrofolate reductase
LFAVTVTLVAAVARNRVIGDHGAIPWRLRGEQAEFKALTMGHVLVMGRRTYDSIGRPLPGRTTVVVSRQPEWQPSGGPFELVLVASGVDEALDVAAAIDDEVFVVGGGEIYRAALPVADRLVISWVDSEPVGDVFFPPVTADDWTPVRAEPRDGYEIVEYARAEADPEKLKVGVTLLGPGAIYLSKRRYCPDPRADSNGALTVGCFWRLRPVISACAPATPPTNADGPVSPSASAVISSP